MVAEKFGKEHRHVLDAIRNLVAQNSAARFFYKSEYENRGKQYPMFIMNRDGFVLLVMGFTGPEALNLKINYIDAFNSMEEKLKNLPQNLTRLELLEMALEAEKKVIALKPKADFADRVIDTGNLVDIGQAAKLLKLGFGRNTFFNKLRNDGIFFSKRNEPKQQYINQDYFELREDVIERTNHPDLAITKVLVTQKGLYWLSKKYGGNFESGLPLLQVS